MNINSFFIDEMTWSFSRLNSFYQCPYCWKMQYLDCLKSENGFFSEFGSLCHHILEKWLKGELQIFELASAYEEEFHKFVKHKAPPNKYVNLSESYYNAGLDYFSNLDESEFDLEVIDVEKEIKIKIEDYVITGYIDLLAKTSDGEYVVIDHKSSDPKSVNSEKSIEYFRQMALYSMAIKEEFGKYPKELKINAFRKKYWLGKELSEEDIEDVRNWVLTTIDLIKKEENWLPKSNSFFCNYICGYRNICEFVPREY